MSRWRLILLLTSSLLVSFKAHFRPPGFLGCSIHIFRFVMNLTLDLLVLFEANSTSSDALLLFADLVSFKVDLVMVSIILTLFFLNFNSSSPSKSDLCFYRFSHIHFLVSSKLIHLLLTSGSWFIASDVSIRFDSFWIPSETRFYFLWVVWYWLVKR